MPETLPPAFAAALTEAAPPATWPAPLAALWWLAKDDPSGPDSAAWERAHAVIQDAAGPDAAWVHAHLHRIEGDPGNARYWYDQAGRTVPRGTLADERTAIIAGLWR
jgi:hypothetical protein